MRQALDKTLRNQLESTVLAAREVVETACREEIERLGVADATVPAFLNDAQRKLRNRLRAHARQLGDSLHDNGKQDCSPAGRDGLRAVAPHAVCPFSRAKQPVDV